MTLRQIRKTVLFLILLLLAGAGGHWFGGRSQRSQYAKSQVEYQVNRNAPAGREDLDLSLFWDVWDRLYRGYLGSSGLDSKKMIYGAISGMVSSAGDPYTVFLPPTENKQAKEDLSGSFEGVGIQLGFKDSKVAVIAPLVGSPAEKAGVKAGDLILKIVDEKKGVNKETTGMPLPEAVTLIRGERGTEVKLTLAREGVEKQFEMEIMRDTILVKSVEVEFIDRPQGKIAHLKLLRFGERTNQEWEEAVNKIKNEKLKIKNFGG
ncbi:PDZ domain-containing protein, partial [Candidatus Shapirobacteria bacterium]|nr:PDZ domain-containing protein [Candidatus Shapirobacteria bacterium]